MRGRLPEPWSYQHVGSPVALAFGYESHQSPDMTKILAETVLRLITREWARQISGAELAFGVAAH